MFAFSGLTCKLFDTGSSAGDSMSYSNGQSFSTTDQDNDSYGSGSCSVDYNGAWWYNACHEANLNGLYLNGEHASYADGINWKTWKGYNYSIRFTEIKMRPL